MRALPSGLFGVRRARCLSYVDREFALPNGEAVLSIVDVEAPELRMRALARPYSTDRSDFGALSGRAYPARHRVYVVSGSDIAERDHLQREGHECSLMATSPARRRVVSSALSKNAFQTHPS